MRRTRNRVLGVLAAFGLAFGLMSPASAASPEPAPLSTDTPVVFVHGYTGSASNWTAAKTVFRANGWSGDDLFAYEYDSYGNNVTNAQGLASFVDNVKSQTGADHVAIVNHSMGGLVSQYYLKVLGGHENVSHLASIAGANHGTTFASACLIYTTCQQMYPGSSFIDEITAGDETPGATEYATWYSACDGVILPYTSTRLDGADNNNVVCQTHLGFLADTGVLREIAGFIA